MRGPTFQVNMGNLVDHKYDWYIKTAELLRSQQPTNTSFGLVRDHGDKQQFPGVTMI